MQILWIFSFSSINDISTHAEFNHAAKFKYYSGLVHFYWKQILVSHSNTVYSDNKVFFLSYDGLSKTRVHWWSFRGQSTLMVIQRREYIDGHLETGVNGHSETRVHWWSLRNQSILMVIKRCTRVQVHWLSLRDVPEYIDGH